MKLVTIIDENVWGILSQDRDYLVGHKKAANFTHYISMLDYGETNIAFVCPEMDVQAAIAVAIDRGYDWEIVGPDGFEPSTP